MAKKMKPGEKRCPNCEASVKGPRTKTCPKCGHEFKGKPRKVSTLETAPAVVEQAAMNGGTFTPDQPKVNKAQAVRDYVKRHPGAVRGEIAAALNKQGIEITPGHVAAIRTKMKKGETAKQAAPVAAAPAAPAAVEQPAKNGGTLTLDQVKQVARTVKTLGGFQRMAEVLEVIKELGGVKKFKELAEAMTATVWDDIPF
jgi:hypothetical protein